jgi:hypothetical protein
MSRKPKADLQPLGKAEIAEQSAWWHNLCEEASSPKWEEYLARIDDGTATKTDHDEFDMRMMARFCNQVYQEQPIDRWVLHRLADAFTNILNGGTWVDEIPLPWTEPTPIRSKCEQRDLEIYCWVANAHAKDTDKNITDLIKEAAELNHRSYETARDAYYKYENLLSKNNP